MMTREEIVAASIERAAQRERDQHQFPGNATARQAARAMWRDFLADQALRRLSGRDLAERYRGISYVTAIKIRDWIFTRSIFPATLVPPEWIKEKSERSQRK